MGKNGIDVLSAAIPGEANRRSREEIVRGALEGALRHAKGEEWNDRPEYENGLAAYDMWADIFEKWALLVKYEKAENIGSDIGYFSKYYAAHYYSARCYAREYLAQIAGGDDLLTLASQAYKGVADCLREVWVNTPSVKSPDKDLLTAISENIKAARFSEEEALEYIERYLAK